MTDDMTNTEEAQEAPEPTELTEEENTEEATESQEAPTGNSEAKKYRLRLREAEARLEALTDRLNAFQREDVLRRAGEHLDAPDDIFTVGGHALEDFLDEAGEVDPNKVKEAAQSIVESRPGLASRVGAYDRYQGYGGAANRELNWADLFKAN